MNELCVQVDAFVDGMLAKEEADAFRAHLGTCSACQREIRELSKLEAIASAHAEALRPLLARPPLPAAPVGSIAKHPAWRRAAPAVAVAIAAAAGWAVVGRHNPSPTDSPRGPVALLDAPTRSLEARLSYEPVDGYRPYEVARSASGPHGEHVSLEALARLEREKDYRGVAAGLVLEGDGDRAAEYLDRAGQSAGVEIDRAVIALGRGHLDDALNLLDPVLEKEPKQKQALWDRALVLRDLHLDLAAAEAFDVVAALGEPGWADEARARARALRADYEDRAQSWHGAMVAGQAMVETGALPPDEVVRRYPSYLGRFLRHALRAAPSRERVLSLLPLARTLDGGDSGGPLVASVNRMAGGDFARRAPLATSYGQLFGKWMMYDFDDAAIDALVARMRAAKEDDLFFGAAEMTGRTDRYAPQLVAIASTRHDPWMDVVAQAGTAAALQERADFASAETTLRAALTTCQADHLDYLCATLESQLARLFIALGRPAEATSVAESGLERSRRQAHNKSFELESEMADVARQRGAFASMRAYLADMVLRNPEYCAGKRQASEFLAAAKLHVFDPSGARAELERGPRCDDPIEPSRVLILAELDRLGQAPPEIDRLPEEIARASPHWLASDRAFADAMRGAALVARDPVAGSALLRGAIDATARLAPGDAEAKKARAWARLNLAIDAARLGHAEEALNEMVADAGGATDTRCSLALGVAYERSFAVTKNEAGDAVAYFDPHRASPDIDPARLVPAEVRARLSGCPTVRVFAPAPVHGTPSLLPDDVAWSYRIGAERPPTTPPPKARRVVVSDVEAPPMLGLPRLSPWHESAGSAPATDWLHGAAATPSRVLAEMGDATEVEIHAHGLVDLAVSDASLLVLSPDDAGRYALTAGDIRGVQLRGRPVVVLGACTSAHVAPFDHEPWSLPLAFLASGARAIFASPAPVNDAEATPFVEAVLARVRAGAQPAQALRDERVGWLARGAGPWIRQVLLFE